MEKIVFGIVGAGWRAEFYLRIAKELSSRFEVCSILVRDELKGKKIEEKWGVKTYTNIDDLLKKSKPSFMVVSVPWKVCPSIITMLSDRGIPVLSETPPAPDLQGLIELYKSAGKKARIQVAEQYQFQPAFAARTAIIESGKLGTISQVQVSAAHGYHGISLIRKLLGIRYENVRITGKRFNSNIIAGPDRNGPPSEEKIKNSQQDVAILDFGEKLAVFDFTNDQYFSWIRAPRILIRGEKGEIVNNQVNYLKDFKTPISLTLNRVNTGENGNLEGYYLKGYTMGDDWCYINPFIPGKLSDDEIAIATCLMKMGEYASGGPSYYSLQEASQDHYLSMMLQSAVTSGTTVETTTQVWAEG